MNRLTLKNKLNRHRFFQSSRKKQLIHAIKENNIRLVRALINDGVDINFKDKDGKIPLITALNFKRFEILDILLERPNIDVNFQGEEDINLLMASVYNNEYIYTKLLLQRPDININLQNELGNTVLMISIYFNRTEIAKLLLEREDIDINLQDKLGNNLLTYSIVRNNIEIAKLLLKREDININSQDNDKRTALINSVYNDRIEITKLLLEREDIDKNLQDKDGKTALMYAIYNTKTEIAKLLLEKDDIHINLQDKGGNTALMFAIFYNNTEIAKLLLKKEDININLQDKDGNTALIYSINKKNTEIIRLLISKNPKISETELLMYEDNGGNDPDIIAYLSIKQERLPMYTGTTQSGIQLFDGIFNAESAPNISMCPICLTYAYRTDGCMYMSHDCTAIAPYYHKDLYKKYSYTNAEGKKMVEWCTVCGRISNHHRHYNLVKANEPNPNPTTLQWGLEIYGNDCIGKGGGGLPEKLSRITEFRNISLSLQDQVGKMPKFRAYKILIEAVWNSPILQGVVPVDKPPDWNNLASQFPLRVSENEKKIYDIPPPSYLIDPTFGYGKNNLNGEIGEDGHTIIFHHKQSDGKDQDHAINIESFKDMMKSNRTIYENFGKCLFAPKCTNCLHPEEVRIISEKYPELSPLYEKYKKDFNKHFSDKISPCHEFAAGGGEENGNEENQIFKGFQLKEATDAVCLLPPRSSTRRNRKFKRTRKNRA